MNTEPSDTPRTDAAVEIVDVAFNWIDGPASYSRGVVDPDFARELERENAALRVSLKEACDLEHEKHTALAVAEGRCELLERELAELRAAIDAAWKEAKP